MSKARLNLTCGLPGSGKTILARQLAADRGAVRLTQDEWLWALGSTPWDESTREKVDHELWRLAQEILRLGLSVVLDFGLWTRIERDEMRTAARGLGVGVELHYLDVPTDDCGGVSRPETPSRHGTATRSAGRTSLGGRPRSRRPMLPSWRCSILRQVQTDPLPKARIQRCSG
jgi:AAA domain